MVKLPQFQSLVEIWGRFTIWKKKMTPTLRPSYYLRRIKKSDCFGNCSTSHGPNSPRCVRQCLQAGSPSNFLGFTSPKHSQTYPAAPYSQQCRAEPAVPRQANKAVPSRPSRARSSRWGEAAPMVGMVGLVVKKQLDIGRRLLAMASGGGGRQV
jgi:hypothetical protein